jgi:hypothetical protein
MAMSLPLSDMKKDVEELVSIINEELVARTKVEKLFQFGLTQDKNKRLLEIREFLKKESDIAFITGLESRKISGKFVDKITDVASRYETEELNMLFKCTSLVLDHMAYQNILYTKNRKQA